MILFLAPWAWKVWKQWWHLRQTRSPWFLIKPCIRLVDWLVSVVGIWPDRLLPPDFFGMAGLVSYNSLYSFRFAWPRWAGLDDWPNVDALQSLVLSHSCMRRVRHYDVVVCSMNIFKNWGWYCSGLYILNKSDHYNMRYCVMSNMI